MRLPPARLRAVDDGLVPAPATVEQYATGAARSSTAVVTGTGVPGPRDEALATSITDLSWADRKRRIGNDVGVPFPELLLCCPVAGPAEGKKVREIVRCSVVPAEQPKRADVVYWMRWRPLPAMSAGVRVSLPTSLRLPSPVWPTVADRSSLPSRVLLSREVVRLSPPVRIAGMGAERPAGRGNLVWLLDAFGSAVVTPDLNLGAAEPDSVAPLPEAVTPEPAECILGDPPVTGRTP